MPGKPPSLLQGTRELIVLQLLRAEPTNGYELAQRIATVSRAVLAVNAGSLYPALYRLEERALVRAAWEESKTGRRVKVCSLTAAGRKERAAQRREWARFTSALAAMLGHARCRSR